MLQAPVIPNPPAGVVAAGIVVRQAALLGSVKFLTPAEAATIERTGDLQVERTWEYWQMEVS